MKRRIGELEHRKKRFVEAYVVEQAIDRPTYQRAIAEADEALPLLHLELHDATLEDLDLEAALGFASHLLTRTSALWEAADASQKRRLQTLVFPESLTFDGNALGTPATASIFRLLGPETSGEVKLVEQKRLELRDRRVIELAVSQQGRRPAGCGPAPGDRQRPRSEGRSANAIRIPAARTRPERAVEGRDPRGVSARFS